MTLAVTLAVALLSGLALGSVYFSLLRRSVLRLMHGNGGAVSMIAALAGRFALAAAVFLFATSYGGWPAVLATLAGFLLVRSVATWHPPAKSLERHS